MIWLQYCCIHALTAQIVLPWHGQFAYQLTMKIHFPVSMPKQYNNKTVLIEPLPLGLQFNKLAVAEALVQC